MLNDESENEEIRVLDGWIQKTDTLDVLLKPKSRMKRWHHNPPLHPSTRLAGKGCGILRT